jgi:hypothetical protein
MPGKKHFHYAHVFDGFLIWENASFISQAVRPSCITNISDYQPQSAIPTTQVTSSHEVRSLQFTFRLRNLIWRKICSILMCQIYSLSCFRDVCWGLSSQAGNENCRVYCDISFLLLRRAINRIYFKFSVFLARLWTSCVIQKPTLIWENCIQQALVTNIRESLLQYFVLFKTITLQNGHLGRSIKVFQKGSLTICFNKQ